MHLTQTEAYSSYGLDDIAQQRLGDLGDLVTGAGFNITGIKDPGEIERIHFLDSLSLLKLDAFTSAELVADVGSGGGLPALVLAIAFPDMRITAVESQRKKCEHIARVAEILKLGNVNVCCGRAEDHARSKSRESYDVVVSRAVASLPVVTEYSLPLLHIGGTMVAMKGLISDQERTQALLALGILGADGLEVVRLDPFSGSRDRLAYVARKLRVTPGVYPRRAGVPLKRPLGLPSNIRTEEAGL